MKRLWHKLFGHPREKIHFDRKKNLFFCECGYSIKWQKEFING